MPRVLKYWPEQNSILDLDIDQDFAKCLLSTQILTLKYCHEPILKPLTEDYILNNSN